MDTFHFFESKRKFKLNIHGGIGIVGKLLVVVLAELCLRRTQSQMPSHPRIGPLLIPVELSARAYEKLHFHLLEFSHTENELTGYDFISEGLSDLCDAERNFHPSRLLHIEEVHKNPLSRFRTEVNGRSVFRYRTHLRGKHQVKLTHIGPVGCAGDWAFDAFVGDQVANSSQIFRFEQSCQSSGQRSGFFHLAFIFQLGGMFLYQDISTVALFAVLVVDHRIVERIHVTGSFPGGRMHKNRRIDPDNIAGYAGHGLPPEALEVVF